jgi:hypothetical protein
MRIGGGGVSRVQVYLSCKSPAIKL